MCQWRKDSEKSPSPIFSDALSSETACPTREINALIKIQVGLRAYDLPTTLAATQ